MAPELVRTSLGPIDLASPLVAASGTVGAVWEWASVADQSVYGAAVAKSVSEHPWEGRPPPRVAPAGPGMLNGIGIQNPGISDWVKSTSGRLAGLTVPVWGSAVGESSDEFASVARGLESAGVAVVEVNLSCPNLENGQLFALDPDRSADVIAAVKGSVALPVGAKLSPNSEDIVSVAIAVLDAGADFVTLTNTAWGFGIDLDSGLPKLSGGVGGYSGPGLKAISLRCVYEVARTVPGAPIVGCGGVATGDDVIEYLMAGASAVALGTVHLSEPRAGKRIYKEMVNRMRKLGVATVSDLIGRALP
jgi:dihydroorotate dehydrogenase (NAD+) catalytic subunit